MALQLKSVAIISSFKIDKLLFKNIGAYKQN